jgi:diguanylate cyclase (GGDEF)-like protein
MSDPELANRRQGNEPVLGYGSYAITDNLTLLYSHRYIHEMVDAEAHRSSVQGSTFAVVLTEITNLADINQARGYAEGDATIKRVAQAVQTAAVRSGCVHGRDGRTSSR